VCVKERGSSRVSEWQNPIRSDSRVNGCAMWEWGSSLLSFLSVPYTSGPAYSRS